MNFEWRLIIFLCKYWLLNSYGKRLIIMFNIFFVYKYMFIRDICVLKIVCNYNKSFMFVRVLFLLEFIEIIVYKGDMFIKI